MKSSDSKKAHPVRPSGKAVKKKVKVLAGMAANEQSSELSRLTALFEIELAERRIIEDTLWKTISEVKAEKVKSEAIISAIGDGIVILDTKFRVIYQNQIHKEILGDYTGKLCFSKYGRKKTVCEECIAQKSFEDGEIHKASMKLSVDRKALHIEVTASPLRDTTGEIIAVIEVVRDISRRMKMEEELMEHRDHLDRIVKERTAELRKANKDLRAEIMRRIQMEKDLIESQRFVHRIADATPNILYLYDVVEEKNIYINPRVKDILGFTPEEVKKAGNFFMSAVHPDDIGVIESLQERFRSAKDGDIIESEYRIRNSTGDWRWVYCRDVTFKRTSDGLLKLILGIAQDVTDRKLTEVELQNSRQQLRTLLAHIQSVREEESTRISREIHDELGQALTAMKMDVAWIIRHLNSDQWQLIDKAQSISRLIDTNIQTVKRISTELRPGMLDNLGLTATLEWQTSEFQKRTGIQCELVIKPEDLVLDRKRSTAIFRIFQETLTNIARHAKAGKVVARLERKGQEIVLHVRDNGRGITEKQISSPKSIGLIGMSERVHFLGGRILITGSGKKGTSVLVSIPFHDG